MPTDQKFPELGEMRRVGECCLEFAPSGAYVEDWRMQPGTAGLAASLVLLAEVRSAPLLPPRLCRCDVCPSAAWAWRLVQDGAQKSPATPVTLTASSSDSHPALGSP